MAMIPSFWPKGERGHSQHGFPSPTSVEVCVLGKLGNGEYLKIGCQLVQTTTPRAIPV
jgi:hypothetical protein